MSVLWIFVGGTNERGVREDFVRDGVGLLVFVLECVGGSSWRRLECASSGSLQLALVIWNLHFSRCAAAVHIGQCLLFSTVVFSFLDYGTAMWHRCNPLCSTLNCAFSK
jgi:hypothetical protein